MPSTKIHSDSRNQSFDFSRNALIENMTAKHQKYYSIFLQTPRYDYHNESRKHSQYVENGDSNNVSMYEKIPTGNCGNTSVLSYHKKHQSTTTASQGLPRTPTNGSTYYQNPLLLGVGGIKANRTPGDMNDSSFCSLKGGHQASVSGQHQFVTNSTSEKSKNIQKQVSTNHCISDPAAIEKTNRIDLNDSKFMQQKLTNDPKSQQTTSTFLKKLESLEKRNQQTYAERKDTDIAFVPTYHHHNNASIPNENCGPHSSNPSNFISENPGDDSNKYPMKKTKPFLTESYNSTKNIYTTSIKDMMNPHGSNPTGTANYRSVPLETNSQLYYKNPKPNNNSPIDLQNILNKKD